MTEAKPTPGRRGGRPNRRTEIVAAATTLFRQRGLQGVTTRAIAESVPCSEGALYVHFKDRLDLILAVLEESLPEMLVPLHVLRERAGEGSVLENLSAAVEGLARFHQRVMGMLCSLIGEPELRDRFRWSLSESGRGPERGIGTLGEYIEQEQALGRIDAKVNANVAARVLMASSFFSVFTGELLGNKMELDAKSLTKLAIRADENES